MFLIDGKWRVALLKNNYSFEQLKELHQKREETYISSLSGQRRHEIMFEPFNVSPTEYRVLAFLYFNGREAEPSVIADSLHILRQTMTKVIDSLEKKSFVSRREHPTDRRRVFITLLPEGASSAEKLVSMETDYCNLVDEQFSKEELDTYHELSWRIQKVSDDTLRSFLAEIDD